MLMKIIAMAWMRQSLIGGKLGGRGAETNFGIFCQNTMNYEVTLHQNILWTMAYKLFNYTKGIELIVLKKT
jgi:hypothetical protein